MDELKETIAAFKDGSGRVDKGDIASAVAAQPAGTYGSGAACVVGASSPGPASGVTTIGFGNSSSSAAAQPAVFGGASSSFPTSAPALPSFSSSSSSAPAAPLMVTKKKKKAPESVGVAAEASAEAAAKVPKAE